MRRLADPVRRGPQRRRCRPAMAAGNDPRETLVQDYRRVPALRRARPRGLPLPRPSASAGEPETAVARRQLPAPASARTWPSCSASSCGPPVTTAGGAEPLAHGIVGLVHAAGDWWLERQTCRGPGWSSTWPTVVVVGLRGDARLWTQPRRPHDRHCRCARRRRPAGQRPGRVGRRCCSCCSASPW